MMGIKGMILSLSFSILTKHKHTHISSIVSIHTDNVIKHSDHSHSITSNNSHPLLDFGHNISTRISTLPSFPLGKASTCTASIQIVPHTLSTYTSICKEDHISRLSCQKDNKLSTARHNVYRRRICWQSRDPHLHGHTRFTTV